MGRKKPLLYVPPVIVFCLICLALLNIDTTKRSIFITIFMLILLFLFIFAFEVSYGTVMYSPYYMYIYRWIYLTDLLPVPGVAIGISIYWNCIIFICLCCWINDNSLSSKTHTAKSLIFVSIAFGVFAFLTLLV